MQVKKKPQYSKMPKSEQFDMNVNFSNRQKTRNLRKQTKCFFMVGKLTLSDRAP